jgi:hypothetical protein
MAAGGFMAPVISVSGTSTPADDAPAPKAKPRKGDTQPHRQYGATMQQPAIPVPGGALPFIKGAGASPPPTAAAAAAAAAKGMAGGTVQGEVISPLAGLPFSKAKATPELSLEQYASMRATCTVYPDLTQATYTRYGVADATVRKAVSSDWQKRLANDKALRARYDELVAQYSDWLRKNPPQR